MAAERRAIVTNNVKDYRPVHDKIVAAGQAYSGMVFSYDVTMPRNKGSVPLWISALETLLTRHADEDALRNRIHHLP